MSIATKNSKTTLSASSNDLVAEKAVLKDALAAPSDHQKCANTDLKVVAENCKHLFDPLIPHHIYAFHYQITEAELDTFGHVNNAQYLRLYERARWEFITQNGFGLPEIQKINQGPVLLEVKLTFRRELKNREWITIYSQIQQLQGKIFTLKQMMVRSDGRLASEGIFHMALFDLQSRKMLMPDDQWRQAIGFVGPVQVVTQNVAPNKTNSSHEGVS